MTREWDKDRKYGEVRDDYFGDGIGLFDEYRGFVVSTFKHPDENTDIRHMRTSASRKDVFYAKVVMPTIKDNKDVVGPNEHVLRMLGYEPHFIPAVLT